MSLPKQYEWLNDEQGPRMLLEALKLYGTQEKLGRLNNPVIMGWAKECGITDYTADSIPWCGLFMAVVAKRASKQIVCKPLWAKSWLRWGYRADGAKLGDVLVFNRDGGGHVGMYIGEDPDTYHVLGGNQNDSVSIVRIIKSRLLGSRNWYPIGIPRNVRPVFLTATGTISTNES